MYKQNLNFYQNKSFRNNFRFIEKKKMIYFFLINNNNLNYKKKLSIKFNHHQYCIKKNSSIVKVRNVCLYSNRKRGVYSKLKVSRIIFRKLVRSGKIPGFRKL